ncbi:L-seryl-tRNA(Sec) selenium transferase (selenocysteine synthase) [Oceanobacillus iheyensis HTE831]|uniref:L-seryl-tRNA(Sec) selenium transferase (Selenocysteine synthase) n=1 Tax=Oceanobacillus iheyensis (strain DSM 14371 / CIP 107618 / JCM 11309 / KCTC 3954 / HTE831) TaxID=221109 RepID=Q8CX64_OCEIH|nr:L-seryl-tRNA(Sec) selenium transferase (selenocysteine synthase) [Oceanobacillus iheyensis HTE831]
MRKVINASGRMSILGVSTISDYVLDGMANGGKHYFEMEALVQESGKQVAKYVHTEHALITNSASAAISLAVAGVISKDNRYLVEHLYEESMPQREILIMKGHQVDYGAPVDVMIHLGGGRPKGVGFANGCSIDQINQAVSENTAAILFVQSHHCVQKNMPSLQEVSEWARQKKIPLIVDAAAEEDIAGYGELADMIIFSGSKAIKGPTSGILAGKTELITYATYHMKGIGRAMKVGKEAIFGLLHALEQFVNEETDISLQLAELDKLKKLEEVNGVKITIQADEAGREIYRGRVHIEAEAPMDASTLVNQLKDGNPAIYTRDYHANEGHFDIDPRPLLPGDMDIIVQEISSLIGG